MGPGLHHAEVRLPALPAVAGEEVGLLQDGSGEKSPGLGELVGFGQNWRRAVPSPPHTRSVTFHRSPSQKPLLKRVVKPTEDLPRDTQSRLIPVTALLFLKGRSLIRCSSSFSLSSPW